MRTEFEAEMNEEMDWDGLDEELEEHVDGGKPKKVRRDLVGFV